MSSITSKPILRALERLKSEGIVSDAKLYASGPSGDVEIEIRAVAPGPASPDRYLSIRKAIRRAVNLPAATVSVSFTADGEPARA